ncbi:protein THYLAKOID ASSEMBLY 8, chloroplastic [Lycium barbarum]|uniref:protein THYLAKOID ASSEMBLY 8, chloroplastic n=1 Tax=Lycium barbarum TaxID=112863 RepID=UPI00293E2E01|nr:protein THYLAKOID ASSEMBLY 8, chloroplastic [Lycium barbarum]
MASSISINLNFTLQHSSLTPPLTTRRKISVRCGPRSNRGPLVKGRILSIEAIQAIQALKRAQRTDPTQIEPQVSKTLNRLIKADLIAAYKELLRQDLCDLALKVFPFVQSECDVPDLGLYADMVLALTRTGLTQHVDELICGLEKEGKIQCDDKGLVRLVRALVEGEQVESTVRVYELMKRSGWGSRFEIDEYVAKVLRRGFKRFGKEELAGEVDGQLQRLYPVILGKQ